jgi:hypothetical protein
MPHAATLPRCRCRCCRTHMPHVPHCGLSPPYVTRHIATCRHMLPRYAATRYMPLCRIAANTFIHAAFDDTTATCHVQPHATLLMLPSVVRQAVVVIAITCQSRHDAAVNSAMTCCHTLRYMPLQMRRHMPHATCHAATPHCHTPHRHTLLTLPSMPHATCHIAAIIAMPHAGYRYMPPLRATCHTPHAAITPHATCWPLLRRQPCRRRCHTPLIRRCIAHALRDAGDATCCDCRYATYAAATLSCHMPHAGAAIKMPHCHMIHMPHVTHVIMRHDNAASDVITLTYYAVTIHEHKAYCRHAAFRHVTCSMLHVTFSP